MMMMMMMMMMMLMHDDDDYDVGDYDDDGGDGDDDDDGDADDDDDTRVSLHACSSAGMHHAAQHQPIVLHLVVALAIVVVACAHAPPPVPHSRSWARSRSRSRPPSPPFPPSSPLAPLPHTGVRPTLAIMSVDTPTLNVIILRATLALGRCCQCTGHPKSARPVVVSSGCCCWATGAATTATSSRGATAQGSLHSASASRGKDLSKVVPTPCAAPHACVHASMLCMHIAGTHACISLNHPHGSCGLYTHACAPDESQQWALSYEQTYCRCPGCPLFAPPPGPSWCQVQERRRTRYGR
eukprot:9196809-Karenia_brevis.AAC.1